MVNRLRCALALGALALVAGACGGDVDREGAIEDLVNTGLDEETATCIVDELEEAGFPPGDFADTDADENVEAVVAARQATVDCLGVDEDVIFANIVAGIAAGSDLDDQQSQCVVDEMRDAGITVGDLLLVNDDEVPDDVVAAFEDAEGACTGGATG